MSELRRRTAHLVRELERHRRRAARRSVTLLDLERHPGYRLLDSGATTGRTARRWAAAQPVRDRMWRDFHAYGARLATAEQVLARRARPGPGELAELRALLREADALAKRTRADSDELGRLVAACDNASTGMLAALAGPAERLGASRRAVARLGLTADDPDAVAATELTARLAEIDHRSSTDPLAFAGTTPHRELAGPAEAVARLHERTTGLLTLRARWEPTLAELDAEIAAVQDRRTAVTGVRARVRGQLRDPVPPLPVDPGAGLRQLVDAARAARGWRARHDAVVAVRDATAAARAELEAVVVSTAGLLERRDDLRGRFGAYRARTARLGHVADPELSDLDVRIGRRLWTVPSEIARATRELAAYRRRLATLATASLSEAR